MTSGYCVHAFVSGRVQGVFFRQSTATQAARLGVRGRAKNLPDGRVEVVAAGAQEQVQELLSWLGTGPPMAQVEHLEWRECTVPEELPAGFQTA